MNRLLLYGLLAGCALFGAILFREVASPAGDASPENAVALAPRPAFTPLRPPRENVEELSAAILARPLFSPTRRPPTRSGSDSAGLGASRLTGIVIQPGIRIAIFAVPNAQPLILKEGEDMNGWRVDSISPQQVSVTGPDGTRTLRPKSDPTLALARPQLLALPNPAGRMMPQPVRAVPPGLRPSPMRPVLPQMRPGPLRRFAPVVRPGLPAVPPGFLMQRR